MRGSLVGSRKDINERSKMLKYGLKIDKNNTC